MKQRHQPMLQHGVEVNQHVAARQQVQPGERRIQDHIVLRKQHHVPDLLADRKAIRQRCEEAGQTLRAQVGGDAGRESAAATHVHGFGVQVGGKDLQPVGARARGGRLHLLEQHGQRVGLFPGRAAGNPGAQGLRLRGPGQHLGQDLLGQVTPHLRVAEKTGHTDQHLGKQQIALLGAACQQLGICRHRREVVHRHPALDAPQQGAGLVQRQVVTAVRAQQAQDGVQHRCHILALGWVDAGGRRGLLRADPLQDAPGHLVGWHHDVHTARGDGAAWHGVKLGRLGLLCQGQPPLGVQGLQPQRAVRAHARQHHPHRVLTLLPRQRAQQRINGQSQATGVRRVGQMQVPLDDGELAVGRDHIDGIALDEHAVGGLLHGQGGHALQQAAQQGLARRVQVLNHDVGEVTVGRHTGEKQLQAGQTTCRGAQADDARLGFDRRRRVGGGSLGMRPCLSMPLMGAPIPN